MPIPCPTPLRALASVAAVAVYVAAVARFEIEKEGAATCVAVTVAALLSAIAGFAFSALCGALLFQFRHDPVGVVQIMLVCSIANQSLSVWALRRSVRASALAPFLAGAAIGLPAGIGLLMQLDARSLTLGLGVALVLIGVVMLLQGQVVLRRQPIAGDVLAGVLGGMLGGVAAIPSVPVLIWCGLKGWDKARQRGVLQPFVLVNQVVALLLTGACGHGEGSIPLVAWAALPASLFGTCWGLAAYRRLSDRSFGIYGKVALIVSGAGLVV